MFGIVIESPKSTTIFLLTLKLSTHETITNYNCRFSDLGIGYKRMAKNGAWRVGAGLMFSTSNTDNDNGAVQTHSYYSISPRIGYEWHQNFNRFQIQYGTDLVTGFYKSTLEEVHEDEAYYRFQQTIDNTISIRPFIGLKVFVTKSISISTETYLDIGFTKGTFENNTATNNTMRTEKGASVVLGPLGVFSINFHF